MGYWYPPPPTVFNPVKRPLLWHQENDGPYPDQADEVFYGAGRGTSPVQPVWDSNRNGWISPPGCPAIIGYEGNSPGPWKNYGDIVCVGGYGSGFNYRDRSPAQRLDYYRKMIALRTPREEWMAGSGDPESGGLAADEASAGWVTINYFDCSDSGTPKRKRVGYPSNPNDSPVVKQWNSDSQAWEDEGFDWDRDLPKIFQGAITAITAVGAVALSFVSVDPAIMMAWSGAMGQIAQAARPGGKIDPFAYMANIMSVTKAIPDFEKVMTSVVLKNDVIASIYAEAQTITKYTQVYENKAETFFSSFSKAVQKNLSYIPKVDLSTAQSLLDGQIPAALIQAGAAPDSIQKSVGAYLLQGENAFNNLRAKCTFLGPDVGAVLQWRQTFDFAYASLLATETAASIPVDPRAMIQQDTQSVLSVARVLAIGKQAASQRGDSGAKSFQQAVQQASAEKDLRSFVAQLKVRYHLT